MWNSVRIRTVQAGLQVDIQNRRAVKGGLLTPRRGVEGVRSRKVARVEWCREGKEAGGLRVVGASYRRSPPIVVQEGGGSIEGHAWRAAGLRADARGGVFHFPFSKIRAPPSRGQETHRGRHGNRTSGEQAMDRALADSLPKNPERTIYRRSLYA